MARLPFLEGLVRLLSADLYDPCYVSCQNLVSDSSAGGMSLEVKRRRDMPEIVTTLVAFRLTIGDGAS
jgi:hypothetical protein